MDRLKDKVAIVTGAGTREVEDRKLRGDRECDCGAFCPRGCEGDSGGY